MRDTLVVNFVGGPGSGKTALCCMLFAALKMQGECVEYIQEIAKTLVWTKEFELLNNQHYVTMKQANLLEAVNGKVDFVVTDGPLLHGLYYNVHNPDNYCDVEKVERMIMEKLKNFNNVYILVEKGNFPYEQVGRLETEEESRQIGKEIKHILDLLQLDYLTVTSGSTICTDDIIEWIIGFVNKCNDRVVC
jgi:hypothetical protein